MTRVRSFRTLLACGFLVLAGCGGSVLLPSEDAVPDAPSCVPSHRICTTGSDTRHFAPGLEPLGDNTAPFPAATATDPYPEQLGHVNGYASQVAWVQARGYVHAGIAAVWQAVRDPDVAVDRRRINSWTVDTIDPSPFPFAIVVHNTVQQVVTVNFDITWGGDIGEGSENAPTLISTRWDKTGGTTFITSITGTCVMQQITPDVTAIEFVQTEQALGQNPDTITTFVEDFYASVVARVHGQPLPTYM